MVSVYDIAGIEQIRRRNRIQPHCMKRFRNALFKHALDRDDALALLPEEARADFARSVAFQSLALADRRDSAIDGASKLAFKTQDGISIETVLLRPQTGRTSVCISSQAGCACGCRFCATGSMGFARNLSDAEILDQVAQANRLARAEGRAIRNVVFMGMGEPLLNLDHLRPALEMLVAAPFFNLSASRITVSTVGVPAAMLWMAAHFPTVRIALSLHSARQAVRERLMPVARHYPLEQLREALAGLSRNGKVMIEYLMLDGVNDGDEDLRALADYLRGLSVHLNLIAYNAHGGCGLRGSPRPRREAFAARLRQAGFEATLRHSFGADIAAACGQLASGLEKGGVCRP